MATESFDLRLAAPFVAVAEELHVGRAAARLEMAQPALSQQVSRLERQLGARLFDRDGRRLRLTAAGERFLVEVREILARANLMEAALAGHAAELRIHLGDSGNSRLNRLVTTFAAVNPEVTVRFVTDTLSGAAAVRAGDAEIGIDLREGVPAELEYLALDWRTIGVLCGRDHRFAGRDELAWSELQDEQVGVAPPGWFDGYNVCIRAHLRANGIRHREVTGPRYTPAMLVHAVSTRPNVLLAGTHLFRPWPAELAWVPLTPAAYFEYGAVWRADRLSPAGRSLLDWMAADVELNSYEVLTTTGLSDELARLAREAPGAAPPPPSHPSDDPSVRPHP